MVILFQIGQLAVVVWAVTHFGWLVLVPILVCGARIEKSVERIRVEEYGRQVKGGF